MKTVLYRKIDGLQIVSGFASLVIDPVETGKIVKEKLPDTDEFKAITKQQEAMQETLQKANASLKAANLAYKAKNKKAAEDHSRDNRQSMEIYYGQMADLKAMTPALEKMRRRLFVEHAVYFMPKDGEICLQDDEISNLMKKIHALQEDSFLDIGGNIIPDNRGIVYWKKTAAGWTQTTISKLGEKVPAKAYTADALTEDQRDEIEAQRISVLSSTQKDAEKIKALELAKNRVHQYRLDLELEGDPDALNKAQVRYAELKEAIEKKYI